MTGGPHDADLSPKTQVSTRVGSGGCDRQRAPRLDPAFRFFRRVPLFSTSFFLSPIARLLSHLSIVSSVVAGKSLFPQLDTISHGLTAHIPDLLHAP